MLETMRGEKDELAEKNNELKRSLEMAETQLRDMDIECQRCVCLIMYDCVYRSKEYVLYVPPPPPPPLFLPSCPALRLHQTVTELRGTSPNRRTQGGSGMDLSRVSSEEMLAKKRYRLSVASRAISQVHICMLMWQSQVENEH